MEKEVYKLLIIKALRSFMIVMPILTIYWQEHGLLLRDIFILQVIFSVAIVALEIPSGYFADIFGRKSSLILGVVMGALGFLLYFLANGFVGFAVAEIVLALSAAFLSGADSAFLYDTLQQYGAVNRHVQFQGKIISAARLSESGAALLCGLMIIFFSFETIFFIQFLTMALAIPVALTITEPETPPSTKKRKNILEIVRFALHENKKLLYLNIFSGVISTSTLTMVWFAQPYWEKINVDIVYFGVMWAILNVLVSISAYFAHKLPNHFSFRKLFGIFAVTPLVLYGLLSLNIGIYSLFIISLFWVLRGSFQPISLDFINQETDSSIRATVVSVSQLFSRLIFAVFSPFLGWIADVWSLELAFLASSVTFGVLSVISVAFLFRHITISLWHKV